MKTKLSVNINKIATLRNSRGGNNPNVVDWAIKIQEFGADGITVHPRPDERHITYQDVFDLKKVIYTEYNIEGNPQEKKFIDLVLNNQPTQVTLVPDSNQQLTSNHGWDTIKHQSFLKEIVDIFHQENIRVSIFLDPNPDMVKAAQDCGTDRIELYTEKYAKQFNYNPNEAIKDFITTAEVAATLNLGLNAGHDLDLLNLKFFNDNIPNLLEVSIGHALVADALLYGMQNTVNLYQRALNKYY